METYLLHNNQSGVDKLLPLLHFEHGESLSPIFQKTMILSWGADFSGRTITGENIQIFNDPKSVLQCNNKKTMRQIIELHGLKISPAENRPEYRIEYRIPIFHLKALSVFIKKSKTTLWSSRLSFSESNRGRFEELEVNERVGFYVRRAMREARKAVYALGLEFALVHIGILGRGDTVVIDVNPTPVLNQRLAQCYADEMNAFATELRTVNPPYIARVKPILIGADPEFILRKPNGKIVSADRFMGREGVVGCDAVVLSGHRIVLPLVELRPQPSTSPIILTHHIRNLMQKAQKMINEPELDWLAGAMPVKGLPLGGHIHFSGVEVNSMLLRVLDNYLALPLVLLESESIYHRRPRYGFLGDFRRQSHGGFEYRSLPSWLVSPTVTVGVLSLGMVIAHHYLELQQRPLRLLEVQRAFYQGAKDRIKPHIEKLWLDIKQTTTYLKYQKELNRLFQMILLKEDWQEEQDFRKNWRIDSQREFML
ncbi:hypothetical protein EHS13_18470 [Paenibacillus psychroresistens]|uniref:Phage phiEco32-like COOH-NH2 ligase-type 2 n=1 Tax=Paenibacillus psychroresistens TaxID=1778678 RepID=A0A6B8RM37_9BACL|nr:hypothetical protein [Paenibacillus psychroresistens]QGQ96722.1 hypothetical protein EHS13_18470 [Paenibacillus psychroresistens]